MRAIQITQPGDVSALQLLEIPIPQLQPGEVLIKVAVSGVNFIDIFVREGRYQTPCPFVPGQEGAGTIMAVGAGVSTFQIGQRVAWCSIIGTYAEYAAAPADRVIALPDELDFQQAAACLLQGMAAHYLVHEAYAVREGDSVLIHAGAGGTGLLMTQMARRLGATVYTTVSTKEKAELSLDAGARQAILYTQTNFAEEVKRLTAGKGLAAVYDSIGAPTFERSLECLQPRGSLVIYGSAGGAVPPFDLERLAGLGSLRVTRPILKHYTQSREELVARASYVFQQVLAKQLTLRIGGTFALQDAALAHQMLEERATSGKLLLLPVPS